MEENNVVPGKGKQSYYPWLVALVAAGMVVCAGLWSSGQSLTNAALRAQLELTGTQTSSFVTCKSLSAFLIVLVFDKWYQKLGLRLGCTLGLLCGALGMLISSFAGTSLTLYYIGAVVGGFCYGLCMAAGASLITNAWFNKHKGLVLGICAAGSGLSSMIFSPIVQSTIKNFSITSAFLLQAVIIAASAVLTFLVLRDSPEKIGLEPYGGKDYVPGQSVKKTDVPKKAYTVFLSNKQIWIMTIILILLGVSGTNAASHIAVVLNDYKFDPTIIGWASSAFGLCMIIGKIGYGFVGDRIGYKTTAAIYALLAMIGYGSLTTLLLGTNVSVVYISYIAVGLGCSLCMMGYPLWATDWAPKADYTSTLKKFQMAYQLGVLISGPLAGIICDLTGSYAWYFFVPVFGYCIVAISASLFYRKLDAMRRAAGEL